MILAERFGKNLVRYREASGLSQEALGFLASLHRTEIGMLERGIRLPRIDTVIKLAASLKVSPGELLAGLGWSPGGPRIGSFGIDEAEEAGR